MAAVIDGLLQGGPSAAVPVDPSLVGALRAGLVIVRLINDAAAPSGGWIQSKQASMESINTARGNRWGSPPKCSHGCVEWSDWAVRSQIFGSQDLAKSFGKIAPTARIHRWRGRAIRGNE